MAVLIAPGFYDWVRLIGQANAQHLSLPVLDFNQGVGQHRVLYRFQRFLRKRAPLPMSFGRKSPKSGVTFFNRVEGAVRLRAVMSSSTAATPSGRPHSKNDLFLSSLGLQPCGI